jgi:hypothetical protein
MTQIILDIEKLEVVDKLKELAQKHDRSLEAEITAILENATENIPISTPPNRGWSEGFFEQTCGSWEGEPLVREPQLSLWENEKLFVKSLNQNVNLQERDWKREDLYDRQNSD